MMQLRASAVGLAVLVALVAACGGRSEVDDQPTARESDALRTAVPEGPKAGPTTQGAARIGDTIDLDGLSDGERMTVTVVTVVDPAQGENEFHAPAQGKRFVGVQFKLTNVGIATYDDSPSNGAVVVDTLGQRFQSTIADIAAGPSFGGSVTIAPGDIGLGFIVFEVPKASKVAKVQFALNSGFADKTGQWAVG